MREVDQQLRPSSVRSVHTKETTPSSHLKEITLSDNDSRGLVNSAFSTITTSSSTEPQTETTKTFHEQTKNKYNFSKSPARMSTKTRKERTKFRQKRRKLDKQVKDSYEELIRKTSANLTSNVAVSRAV